MTNGSVEDIKTLKQNGLCFVAVSRRFFFFFFWGGGVEFRTTG